MTEPTPRDERESLLLCPFRGMRYNATLVGDVGEVTSPPYDVMDRTMIDSMLNQHPRNIVRLILPRLVTDPATGGDPYERAARRLERWRARGILRTDDEPALYLYEYGMEGRTVRGLVGALRLPDEGQHVVLPHEDVIAGVVADRLALLQATQANLEPILLVYDGAGGTAELLDRTRAGAPLTEVLAADGTVHRLWSISDPADIEAVQRELAPHQALIADGHHRYATYRRLKEQHRGSDSGPGPWDRGLVLLVDQAHSPLTLAAIHRSVSELSLDAVTPPTGYHLSEPSALAERPQREPVRAGEFVLTDGVTARTLQWEGPREAGVSDAERLRDVVLPGWGVTDDRVGFHHTTAQAVDTAHQDGGVAILLHPAEVAEVMSVARAGKVMPRKSTSFGPKPRMGLIMRSVRDGL